MEAVSKKAASRLQQRDGENEATYDNRKAIADTKLNLIRSLLVDIEQARAWTEWPEGNKPFRAHGRIQAKIGSKLHGFFTTLGSGASQRVVLGAGNVGSFGLTLNIPSELRPLLNSWLRDLIGGDEVELLGSGVTRLAGRLDVDAGQLKFVVGCHGDLTDSAARLLTKPRGPILEFGPIKLEAVEHAAAEVEGGVALAFSTQANGVLPAQLELDRSDSAPLAIVELDLAPLLRVKNNRQIRKLLSNIERAYTRSRQSRPTIIEMAQGVLKKPDAESLLKRAAFEGDWKITARVNIRRNVATVDVTVGADAHRFWRLRQVRFE